MQRSAEPKLISQQYHLTGYQEVVNETDYSTCTCSS